MKNRSITQLAALGVVLLLWAVYLGLGAGPAAADTTPVASRTPESIDFGTQQAGSTSAPRTITVTALSDGFKQVCDPTQPPPDKCEFFEVPTQISKLTIGGTDAGAFSVSSQNCTGRDLGQGDTCSVEVTFSPAAAGSHSATLTIDSDGSWSAGNQVRLSGKGSCTQNENGTKIAYSGSDGQDSEIYTIDDTGGTPCPLTRNLGPDNDPSLSSDGKKIAYEGVDPTWPGDIEIYTIDAIGGTPFNVTRNDLDDDSPSYSPDGKKIAYSGWDANYSAHDIYTIDSNGGTPFNVTSNSNPAADPQLAYSPDGKKIAYQDYDGQDSEIYTIDANGGTPFQVTNNSTDDFSPSYSSDGTKIAYSSSDGQDYEIYTIDAGGGTPYNVTNNTTPDFSPSYSPDGKKIAYQGFDGQDYEIYTIDANGGAPFQVTNNTTQDRSPSYPVPSTPPDTTAPKVTNTTPPANATGVAPGVNLTATFSEQMDPKTLVTTSTDPANPNVGASTTFKLMKAGTTTSIGAVVSYDTTAKKATLDPNANLKLGTKYKAVVTTGAKDAAGNVLDQDPGTTGSQPKQWVFTVRR